MNHTRFPKEDHLPDCASRDTQIKNGDLVEYILEASAASVYLPEDGGSRCLGNVGNYLL